MAEVQVDVLKIPEIVNSAFLAASRATQQYLDDNPGDWYPCGFAWVRIRPARGRVVKYLKDHCNARVDDFAGGLIVYNPSGNSTQSMYAKAAGANAFAEVLKNIGIKATAETRID